MVRFNGRPLALIWIDQPIDLLEGHTAEGLRDWLRAHRVSHFQVM